MIKQYYDVIIINRDKREAFSGFMLQNFLVDNEEAWTTALCKLFSILINLCQEARRGNDIFMFA